MKHPKLNARLLVDLIEWAEASEKAAFAGKAGLVQIDDYTNPRTGKPLKRVWDQGQWTCGTACCIAGGAAVVRGVKIRRINDGWGDDVRVRESASSDWIRIENYAQRILGLTEFEASVLFDSCNGTDELRTYANEYAGERGITLPWSTESTENTEDKG